MKRLIIFDGADGSSKSTQLLKLSYALEEQGFKVKKTRAVGGTGDDWIQNRLRELLLSPEFPSDRTIDEERLFSLADLMNMQQMGEYLSQGDNNVVLADRGLVSHIAYFAAKGHSSKVIEQAHSDLFDKYVQLAAEHGILNLVFIPEDEKLALERVASRGEAVVKRLENLEMQKSVINELRKGLALLEPYGFENTKYFHTEFITVNRADSIEAIHAKVLEVAKAHV